MGYWRQRADGRLGDPPAKVTRTFNGQAQGWKTPVELEVSKYSGMIVFQSSSLTLLVGWQEGQLASKKLGLGLLAVTIWLEFCTSCSCSCHHHHLFHHPPISSTQIIPIPPSDALPTLRNYIRTKWQATWDSFPNNKLYQMFPKLHLPPLQHCSMFLN